MGRFEGAFCWWGGKARVVEKLLKYVPRHNVYVEVFGGAASLLLAKKPSVLEIYNDIDSQLVNFFRILRDEGKAEELIRRLRFTPYSREEFNFCKKNIYETDDEIERARRWYTVVSLGFGNVTEITSSGEYHTGWGYSKTGRPSRTHSFRRRVDSVLLRLVKRIRHIQIEHMDFVELLPLYDSKDTFFYCDPPYMEVARYTYCLTRRRHLEFLNMCVRLEGMILVSGYWSRLYDSLVSKFGWTRVEFTVPCVVNSKGKVEERTEYLWASPNAVKNTGINIFLKNR